MEKTSHAPVSGVYCAWGCPHPLKIYRVPGLMLYEERPVQVPERWPRRGPATCRSVRASNGPTADPKSDIEVFVGLVGDCILIEAYLASCPTRRRTSTAAPTSLHPCTESCALGAILRPRPPTTALPHIAQPLAYLHALQLLFAPRYQSGSRYGGTPEL